VPAGEARDAAAHSAALSGRIGATGDQERALRCARDLNARHRRPGPRPAHGLDALTSREVRVAELLAAGATKQQVAFRLFLSFHTVDSHLRAIYAKLGVHSRLQLGRLWDARQRSAPPG
jgi:DNA-binding NarL/FixJ family response regulator